MGKKVFVLFIILILYSCREVILVEKEEEISGYQINGLVTDASGNPIENVNVYLFYNYTKISSTPFDTVGLYISDPNINVIVDVYDAQNRYIKNLFTGKLPIGPVQRYTWNGELDGDSIAPSGYYKIVIRFNNQIVKEYPIIIDGNKTAVSDKEGKFFIFNENLPVGKIFDRYDYLNRYIGTYKIESTVLLEIEYRSIVKRGYVSLNYNKITKVNVTL